MNVDRTKSIASDAEEGLNELFQQRGESCSEGASQRKGSFKTEPPSPRPQAMESANETESLIAICGISVRLPGGINDTDTYWDVLVNGKDTQGPIPVNTYHDEAFSAALGAKECIETRHGYFLEDDPAALDPSFFTMTKAEIERTDPQQRMLLEVVRECLENAGETQYAGKAVGCYVGSFTDDWAQMISREVQHKSSYVLTGYTDMMIANRVSYEFDLQGPSLVIKTGCSASLVALHEACRAIRFGDCNSAIVAGSNLILGPTTTAFMSSEGVLSPDGSCKSFDASANGFARAESVSAVYVKSLHAALRDNNPIRAVVRNTASNCDGRSSSLTAPSSAAHEALMRKAYADVGLDPHETPFVECHGTGTATGDPIETTAVGRVFGHDKGVYIGSVKPNIGHAEGASGIASLVKAVLALERDVIPPQIKFNEPNPKIDFKGFNMMVPLKPTAFPQDCARRVSVNSFGIGGANAHAILERNDGLHLERHDSVASSPASGSESTGRTTQLLLLSGNSQSSLEQLMRNVEEYVSCHSDRIHDIAYTLSVRRQHLPLRSYAVWQNGSLSITSAQARAASRPPTTAFVFSGQGAQWPTMGRDLIRTYLEFRRDIQAMDKSLQSFMYPPDWSLEEELCASSDTSKVNDAQLSQPLCTAVQIAVFNMLSRLGLRPAAVVGHSSGEIAAAYAAGSLCMAAAMAVSYYRGYALQYQQSRGRMAAVPLGAVDLQPLLTEGVTIACENSPESTTLSGDQDAVEITIRAIKASKPDLEPRMLKVDRAYHSHQMREIEQHYLELMEQELLRLGERASAPEVRFFSSVHGNELAGEDQPSLAPSYWQQNLVSPVLFSSATNKLLAAKFCDMFIEIGPHSTLSAPLRQICKAAGQACKYVPTMIRNKNSAQSFLSATGQLFQHGLSLEWAKLTGEGSVLSDLPRYPYDHSQTFWYESRVSANWRFRKHAQHSLLGYRVAESADTHPTWRNQLHLEDEPWLHDHKVRTDVVFPFAGYVSIAGEAFRQHTGNEGGFAMRHCLAKAPLVLNEDKSVEIVTMLRPHQLTDAAQSAFWRVAISTCRGSSWIVHFEAEVGPKSVETSMNKSPDLIRIVDETRWYESMAAVGLVYGPTFRNLGDIKSTVAGNEATAKIQTHADLSVKEFSLHPAVIDNALQLTLVALANGAARGIGKLSVPVKVEELVVSNETGTLQAHAWANGGNKNGVRCISSDGHLALQLKGLNLALLEDDDLEVDQDKHAAARLHWQPHFDFVDHEQLFSAAYVDVQHVKWTEELTMMCALDALHRVEDLTAHLEFWVHFRDWLRQLRDQALRNQHPLLENPEEFVHMPSGRLQEQIEEHAHILADDPLNREQATLEATLRIWRNVEDLFTGKRETLDLLMEGGILTDFYIQKAIDHSKFTRLLSHTKPNLRILEVGAGTGGTTQTLLKDLIGEDGVPRYESYTFTDLSAGFFIQAGKKFGYAPNMEYKVFDISKDPLEQGFQPESYDLVLAPNVVHATPRIRETLENLHFLLKKGGRLVLTELCGKRKSYNYIFGCFEGWWLGKADNRPWEPYVDTDRWDEELKQVGFTGTDTIFRDATPPYHCFTAIVSQRKYDSEQLSSKAVTMLVGGSESTSATTLKDQLQSKGYEVAEMRLGDLVIPGQPIIAVVDAEKPLFKDITQHQWSNFQKSLSSITKETVLWVTKASQMKCNDPEHAQSIGIARTVRSELQVPFVTLEIDSSEWHRLGDLAEKIFSKIELEKETEKFLPDHEYVVSDGEVFVGRFHPFKLESEILELSTSATDHQGLILRQGKIGDLDQLHWATKELQTTLDPDMVEIKTKVVGLNFRDAVAALGVIPTGETEVPLGLEPAGVVERVGNDVQDLVPGDRVFAISTRACFASHVVLPKSLVVKMPLEMTFEEAATMSVGFATAVRSLIDIGGLKQGQQVLIHSAAGGVGNAAIQICQLIGAEIYATVGSEEKVKFLAETWGLDPARIYNSRDASFVEGIMRHTESKGVDIVLNSLSGELLHATWKVVAGFGKLIEIGKRDLVEHGKLDMQPFLANRSYCCVDVAHFLEKRPNEMGDVMRRIGEWAAAGRIKPLPHQVFDAPEVVDCFRALVQGNLIGKAVVRTPQTAQDVDSKPSHLPLLFPANASYLLTGGVGGLGKALILWMIERGARSFLVISRSAGSKVEDHHFEKEVKALDARILFIAGRAEDSEVIRQAASSAPHPVRGIVHLAMNLRDENLVRLSLEDWKAVNEPKIGGAVALHEQFSRHEYGLDFFLLASSMITVVETPGQGNYTAANSYLEAFAQWRRHQGLPCNVLNICAMKGVGFIAGNVQAARNVELEGLYSLDEQAFLDYVEHSILRSSSSSVVDEGKDGWYSQAQVLMGLRSTMPLTDPNNRTVWRRDRRMALYHNIDAARSTNTQGGNVGKNELQEFLDRASQQPEMLKEADSRTFLAQQIVQRIGSFMMREDEELEVSASPANSGMDSLVAVELRRWWKQVFRMDVTVLEVMSADTFYDLGTLAAKMLLERMDSN